MDDEFDDDEETVKGMARLFCEVAEAYIQLILAATPQVGAGWVCSATDCTSPAAAWRKLPGRIVTGTGQRLQGGTVACRVSSADSNPRLCVPGVCLLVS